MATANVWARRVSRWAIDGNRPAVVIAQAPSEDDAFSDADRRAAGASWETRHFARGTFGERPSIVIPGFVA